MVTHKGHCSTKWPCRGQLTNLAVKQYRQYNWTGHTCTFLLVLSPTCLWCHLLIHSADPNSSCSHNYVLGRMRQTIIHLITCVSLRSLLSGNPAHSFPASDEHTPLLDEPSHDEMYSLWETQNMSTINTTPDTLNYRSCIDARVPASSSDLSFAIRNSVTKRQSIRLFVSATKLSHLLSPLS